MNIDELQARFNEMRGKKRRTVGDKKPVYFSGFRISAFLPIIYVNTENDSVCTLHACTLELMESSGFKGPFIEEVTPYKGWPMDAKIRVWNLPDDVKEARHFAGVNEDGLPLAWVNGCTSHTTNITAVWRYAELVEDGE